MYNYFLLFFSFNKKNIEFSNYTLWNLIFYKFFEIFYICDKKKLVRIIQRNFSAIYLIYKVND